MASAPPHTQPFVDTGRGRADAGRHGSRRRRRKRSRPRPQLVLGLPARPVDGRVPARQRLGRRERVSVPNTVASVRRNQRRELRRTPVHQHLGPKVTEHPAPRRRPRRFSSPNADGWREVLPRRTGDNSVDARRHPARQPPPPRRPLPAELSGRCLNCLSYKHRRAVCKLPTRCLCCLGFQHLARDCKRPRSPRPGNSVACGHDGPSPAVAAHAGGKRRRCRSRRLGRTRGSISGASTGSSGDAALARAAHGDTVPGTWLLGTDPLLTLWPCDTPNSRDTMDYPMLEKFTASVRSLGAALAAARLEDEPPAEVAHTRGLPGRQQMPPQYVDSVLQTPPPHPTLRVADSPTSSSL